MRLWTNIQAGVRGLELKRCLHPMAAHLTGRFKRNSAHCRDGNRGVLLIANEGWVMRLLEWIVNARESSWQVARLFFSRFQTSINLSACATFVKSISSKISSLFQHFSVSQQMPIPTWLTLFDLFFFVPSDTCTTACNYITYFYQYLTARDNLDYACTFVFLCSIATRHATVCIQGKLKFLAADFVLVGFSVFGLVLVRKYGYFSVLQIADLTESKSGFSRQRLANWRASGEIVYRARLNQHGNYKFIIDRIDMTDVQEWKTRFFLVFPVPLFTLGKTYPTTVTVTQIIERFYFYTQIAIFKMISVRIWITKSIWKQQTQTVIFITSTEKI